MGCKVINGLILDKKSQEALNNIKKKSNFGNALAIGLSVGVFSNIFTKNNILFASYNISQTDWVSYSQAMRGVPDIAKRAVLTDIAAMIMDYEINYDYKHLEFWKGLYYGCKQK